ncbi:MAG: hypothetical protein QW568_01685 [Candidatus Anstonellaceae archaeon]
MKSYKPPLPKGLKPEVLRGMAVSDLSDEHIDVIGELLQSIGDDKFELSEDLDLSFLAELWLAEKMKGREGNKDAMRKIEAIVISATGMPRGMGIPFRVGGHHHKTEHDSGRIKKAFSHVKETASQIFKGTDKSYGKERQKNDSNCEVIKTSVTLEYQSDRWGIDRIALDGIQNHLPSDSKGTKVEISYLVGGEWMDWTLYKEGKIDAIKFSDDGNGYSSRFLELFKSTKKDDSAAVGHFGEGLKMLSAACVREGIDLELRSRDWSAKPFVIPHNIEGHKAEQLAFKVWNGQKEIAGSESIFWNPSKKLVEYVSQLEDKVLLLRKNFKYLYKSAYGAIVDNKNDIFARGVFITKSEKLLFSYDFDIIPNRDRDNVSENALRDKISFLWEYCKDPSAIALFFKALDSNPQRFESSREFEIFSRNSHSMSKEAWVQGFFQHYGKNAVLTTSLGISQMIANLGYTPVVLPVPKIASLLKQMGVRTDFDVLGQGNDLLYLGEEFDYAKIKTEIVPTGISLNYRAKAWDDLRIFLDSVSNHLPQDSGGTAIKFEYLVEGNGKSVFEWKDPRNVGSYAKVIAIRISDDGRGYAFENLQIMGSDKTEAAVGQFGEGLKMLSAACVRQGIPVKFSSRDWFAMPIKQSISIDSKGKDILAYQVVKGGVPKAGSSTVFFSPSEKLRNLFDNRSLYFLRLAGDMIRVLHQNEIGSVFEFRHRSSDSPKNTYVKGVFLCANTSAKTTLFDYNIITNSISPDRDNVDINILKSEMAKILQTCQDPYVIRAIIERAAQRESFIEKELKLNISDPAVKGAWELTFSRVFGQNAVLESKDPAVNYDAEHLGYNLIYVNDELEAVLKSVGVRTAYQVVFESPESDKVPIAELTPLERKNLALTKYLDKILRVDLSGSINIFTEAKDRKGVSLSVDGFWDGTSVNLRRDVLSNAWSLVKTYAHEVGHAVTGAPDPADRFRAFFERSLTSFLVREIKERGAKFHTPQTTIDYAAELKRLGAEQIRLAAMRKSLNHEVELTLAERKKLDETYREELQALRNKLMEKETELSFEQQKRWYEKTSWYRHLEARWERKMQKKEGK